jgi:hypothetical protein
LYVRLTNQNLLFRMERMQQSKQLAPLSGAIPAGLRYNVGVADGISAVRHLTTFTAENASVFGPNNSVIRIPVSSHGFLDHAQTRLCFDLHNVGTAAVTLDGGASCVIQRLRVLSVQNVELERIENYALLHSVLTQYTSDRGMMAADGLLTGAPDRMDESVEATAVLGTPAVAAADGAPAQPAVLGVAGRARGFGYDQRQAISLAAAASRRFEIGLHAGWFNSTTGKFLPPSTSYILELTLYQGASCMLSTAAVDYTLRNVELKIPVVTVQDGAFLDRVAMMQQQGVSWRATTYKSHVNTTAAGAGADTVQISDRSMSLKGIFSIMRAQANINSRAHFKHSKRSIQPLEQYQYTIGSELYPRQQVDIQILTAAELTAGGTAAGDFLITNTRLQLGISNCFAEVQRCFGTSGNRSGGRGLIGAESFGQSELNNGTGLIGCDLSAYSDSSVSSGLDTATQALPVSLRIVKNAAARAVIQQIDTYCIADIEFMLMADGTLSSRS